MKIVEIKFRDMINHFIFIIGFSLAKQLLILYFGSV
jgi:hypothetical protein